MAKIAIGMSGGVDSTVAAGLLKAQGHEVIGVTLALWRGSLCCSFEDVERAKVVCHQMGIKHYLIEALEDFRSKIVEPFILGRIQGQTPNPCVHCNKYFKFGLLWDHVIRRDPEVEALASGHYARLSQNPESQRWEVFQAADPGKDQSYMLWQLSQEQLARSVFPLGNMMKSEVRAQAAEMGLQELAAKPDSQDLCFVVPTSEDFWRQNAPEACEPGEIVNQSGKVIGKHTGRVFYTPGQRKGLGGGSPERQFVMAVEPDKNRVMVATREQNLSNQLLLNSVNWVSIPEPVGELEAFYKLSSRAKPVAGKLICLPEQKAKVELLEAQMRVGQGQSTVIYDENGRLLGGGLLEAML